MSSLVSDALLPSRFSALEPLGVKGMTFAADDEESGHKVVVKRLALGLGLGKVSWKDFELFEREAQTLATLDHSGIPKLLDVLEGADGMRLLVLEHVPGKTLATASRGGARLKRERLTEITIALLDTLQYLHELTPSVVHRDIKPENIVLADDGRVVLVDFGSVAKAQKGDTTVGTFGYMAPEQLHGEARPESDLYALGMTILAVAMGREPEEFSRRGLTPIVPLHALGEKLAGVVSRMVEHEPNKRPSSAKEVKAALVEGGGPLARVLESSPRRVKGVATAALEPPGMLGKMTRRDIRSWGGISAIELSVIVSIPIVATAGALGMHWLMVGVPALLGVMAVAWHRRQARGGS